MKKLLLVLAATLALAPSAGARHLSGPTPFHTSTAAPQGLHAFLLRPDEAPQPYYPRTPSFAWSPVSNRGGSYDFELSTSRSFSDASVLFTYEKVAIPALAIAHQLPWMTGLPYALWAHVRWESANGKTVTPWSQPLGFNMRWADNDYPQQLPAPVGLIRWKPIEGATRYEVLYPDIRPAESFQTTTNVADEREFFTLHDFPVINSTIHWRVRAIRYIDDADLLKNGMPRATYGPWSKVFTSVNPPASLGALTPAPTDTISDAWNKKGQPPVPHELTPGFAWTPSLPVLSDIGAFGSSLYRVYISTDDHCVNVVFTGSIVGSPSYAPRTQDGPLALPGTTDDLITWDKPPYIVQHGAEARSYGATGKPVILNELAGGGDAKVDLWDSGWPNGRYYWTVIPVTVEASNAYDPSAASQPIEYHDVAVPQDSCEAGLGMSFGKVSQPVVTASSNKPWVSGLDPSGRMVAGASKVPTVHDSPLVAWEPAVGANTYDVELSHRRYPWKATWKQTTAATAIVLPLGKADVGSWWYRVRGINPALPNGANAMTWSTPVRIRVTGDRFVIVK